MQYKGQGDRKSYLDPSEVILFALCEIMVLFEIDSKRESSQVHVLYEKEKRSIIVGR